MNPSKYTSVLDILQAKFEPFLLPNLKDLELYQSEDGHIISQVTFSNNDSGSQKMILKTGERAGDLTPEGLREWFSELPTKQTYFYFDLLFADYPDDSGSELDDEFED